MKGAFSSMGDFSNARAVSGFLGGMLLAGAPFLMAAQPDAAPARSTLAPLPYQSTDKTMGVVTCASSLCHGAIMEWKGSPILQTEYVTWSRVDKHARAQATLLSDRSRTIAENLGLSEPAERSKVCLDCHAHNPEPSLLGPRAQVSDGVSCEGCHGPAERWISSHAMEGATHARNLARGMYPTDEPLARARLCLSCHFGNADRFVTHRLMGAGHPRLSFELETFSQIGPSHVRVDADYEARKGKWNGVKVWAIGQALAVSETMKILTSPERGRDGLFPELVLFDCYACHHPMSEKRWSSRSPFGERVAPGLVRLNDANALMLRAITRVADPAGADDLNRRVQALHRAVAGEGDVAGAASALGVLAERQADRIAAYRFDEASLQGVALALVEEGLSGHYTDYAAAEQSVMAIGSVMNYLHRQKMVVDVGAINRGLATLRASLADDEKFESAEFLKGLGVFRDLLAASFSSPGSES